MTVELWGAQSEPMIGLPTRPGGWLLLLVFLLIGLGLAAFHGRRWLTYTGRRWATTFGLILAALLANQLVIVSMAPGSALPPIGAVATPQRLLYLVGGIPLMIAAISLLPAQAALVGLSAGLSRALWQSGSAFDPLILAAVAAIASALINQKYRSWGYRVLRLPVVAAVLAYLLMAPLGSGLSAIFYAPASASLLAAFDLGRSTMTSQFLPVLLEALLAGIVASVLLWGLPQMAPPLPAAAEAPAFSRTVSGRLLSSFSLFSLALTIILGGLVFTISRGVARDLILRQMTQDANGVSNQITDFRRLRQNLLLQFGEDPRLQAGASVTDARESLQQLYRTGTFFRRVMLIDTAGTPLSELSNDNIVAFYPDDTPRLQLANPEKAALAEALRGEKPTISQAEAIDGGQSTIAFVLPLPAGDDGEVTRALVGRVNELSFQKELIDNLSGTADDGYGFIVDEVDRIIGHPDPAVLLTTWQPRADERRVIRSYGDTSVAPGFTGQAIEGVDTRDNTRQLLYYVRQAGHPWTVVITVPYEVVLQEAVVIAWPLVVVALAATVGFFVILLFLSRNISRPLTDLLRAARSMTAGDYTPIEAEAFGFDEVGELGTAFVQMQRTLSKRLSELSLLLDVSQSVSASLNNLSEGVLPLLRGGLRGTGAAGARVIVVNPSGRLPLTYGEGPAADRMGAYDRYIMPLLQQNRELILANPAAIRRQLEIPAGDEIPFQAAVALGLINQKRLSGVLWLAYRDPHDFEESELRLLRTLAGQATVLLENARLYANAEGGRRRLLAVLDSTTDAVIVTDPVNRILLINPAMEAAFGLRGSQVRGRRVADVIQQPALVRVLTARQGSSQSAEIPLRNGKTYSAAASTIVNTDGQVQGRVAVLHDITYMKELDEMKSNFVQMVSHDLRSPLTYMIGFASMLPMAGELNEKQIEYVEGIQKGIDQMNTLVRNLLDLGRLEAGLELMRAPVLLTEVMQNVVEDYELMAKELGVQLVIEKAGKIPYLHLDAPLVQQAVANLVTNAIKYAPNSGQIALRVAIVDQEVVVSVADGGPGISKDDQKHLYDKFVRGMRRDPHVKGSGLGLSIVKLVAERHGGRAWFASEEGQGSTFYISFPLDPVNLLISES